MRSALKGKTYEEIYGYQKAQQALEKDRIRLRIYKKYGYQTLIVWQHELNNYNVIKHKLINFNKRLDNGRNNLSTRRKLYQ